MNSKIVVITTTRCNLRCKHCLRGYYTEQTDVPLDLLARTFQEAKQLGIYNKIGFTLNTPNYAELPDILELALEHWCGAVRIARFLAVRSGLDFRVTERAASTG